MFGWSYPAGCNGTPYDDEPPIFCNSCGMPENQWNMGSGNTFEMDDEIQLKEDGEQVCFCSHECRTRWYVPDTIHNYKELADLLDIWPYHGDGNGGLVKEDLPAKEWEHRIDHSVYKLTDCGASCQFIHEEGSRYSSFRVGIRLGSIVEGVDYDTEYYDLWFPFTQADFYNTLSMIEEEALNIWNETHGCDRCELDGLDRAINPDCPECHGQGIII